MDEVQLQEMINTLPPNPWCKEYQYCRIESICDMSSIFNRYTIRYANYFYNRQHQDKPEIMLSVSGFSLEYVVKEVISKLEKKGLYTPSTS